VALALIPLLPLLAALAMLALRSIPARAVAWVGAGSLLLSAWLTGQLCLLKEQSASFSVPWFVMPDLRSLAGSKSLDSGIAVPLALQANLVELLFLLTTALIGAAVLAYAARERQGDPRARVFFATLTLFAGSMLLFVASDTLVLMYIAWELMGVCSYLLIAHRGTAEARRAARQAFWTTRATDTGLLFAVLLLMTKFNWATASSVDIGHLFAYLGQNNIPTGPYHVLLGWIALLLLFACVGKAAQLPLSFWLPDAMVAPAPVSALLHAAAMVAAGPFLLIRFHRVFPTSEAALLLAVLLGGLTLLLGGLMALCAEDPKRLLAYSTLSQLGLVVMSVGALAEEPGLYHLIAHAWFKAALFLAVGYLALAPGLSSRGQDSDDHGALRLRDLAGAARHPLVRWALILAGLSLAGAAPLAGALGKEQVLFALLHRTSAMPYGQTPLGQVWPVAAAGWVIGAMLFMFALPITAAYAMRLAGVLCFGKPAAARSDVLDAARVAPGWQPALWVALLLAVAGSLGWAVLYGAYKAALTTPSTTWKWGSVFSATGLLDLLTSQALVWGGAIVSWVLFVAQPELGERLLAGNRVARFFKEGMYLREFWRAAVGRTGELCAALAGRAETRVVDNLALRCGALGRALAALSAWLDRRLVDGLRYQVCEACWRLKRLHSRTMQTGSIQHYMFVILLGTALLCLAALRPLCLRLAEIFGRM
jgi:NADH-quinone oxidoreductase subunit L